MQGVRREMGALKGIHVGSVPVLTDSVIRSKHQWVEAKILDRLGRTWVVKVWMERSLRKIPVGLTQKAVRAHYDNRTWDPAQQIWITRDPPPTTFVAALEAKSKPQPKKTWWQRLRSRLFKGAS